MKPQYVADYLNQKIRENEDYIVCTFYDLRVNHNLSEDQVQLFLILAKVQLENMNYRVYFTNAKYTYNNEQKKVKENEYMVAIKENV